MKVIVAHPGQQHSFKVAYALKQQDLLFKYITAVYDKTDNLAMKIAHKLVRGKDVSKIAGRKIPGIDDTEVITFYTFLSLAVIVLSRYKKTKRFSYYLDRRIADYFGIKVAKFAIKNDADVVICFSMNERTCFEYLEKHAPKIKRVVDCANSPVDYMRKIYESDVACEELKKEAPTFWNTTELAKQKRGIDATQYFLAPSEFVKKGLLFCGAKEENIFILPYGSNFQLRKEAQDIPLTVRFIYVGQVTHRKGMHYLLKAFSELQSNGIEIEVVGGYQSDSILYTNYKKFSNIHFHGNVPHDKVEDMLKGANVFVFDSLTEGLSLSCLEALSCGLPVICSAHSGVNDFIQDGYNGFVIDYKNVDAIKNKVTYFFNHPELISEYSNNALKTAESITWSLYGKKLCSFMRNI